MAELEPFRIFRVGKPSSRSRYIVASRDKSFVSERDNWTYAEAEKECRALNEAAQYGYRHGLAARVEVGNG